MGLSMFTISVCVFVGAADNANADAMLLLMPSLLEKLFRYH